MSAPDRSEKSRPRICFLVESYFPVVGGMETQARILAEDFTARGIGVMVVTRRSVPSSPAFEQAMEGQIYRLAPAGNGPLRRWGFLFTCLPALVRLRGQYDIVHVMGFRVLGAAALVLSRLFGKGCVLRAETDGEMSGEFFAKGLEARGLKSNSLAFRVLLQVRNRILRTGECFVSISSDITAELVHGGIDVDRIRYIPNSVDIKRFAPVSRRAKEALRVRLGLRHVGPIAVFTGRLVSFKGLPLLVRVWQRILDIHPDAQLLLVGGGGADLHNCEAELRSFAEVHQLTDSIVFTGDVRNVEEYLQAADLFVFPTEKEAFGISLIEAMACGLPIVSTRAGGLKDIVVDRVNGLTVETGDHQALEGAILRLLADPALANRLGRAGLSTVRRTYARNVVAARYIDLIEEVAAGRYPSCERGENFAK
jgi:glycosyltransferase involved in cell wall biosynthesis